jgi:hypothetical protein
LANSPSVAQIVAAATTANAPSNLALVTPQSPPVCGASKRYLYGKPRRRAEETIAGCST